MSDRFPRVAALRDARGLRARLVALGLDLPCDDEPLAGSRSPLGAELPLPPSGGPAGAATVLANRFVVQPMEGWDGTAEGRPSELTVRRWRRFGTSGAAWIWGGEAASVAREGRANPRQLVVDESTAPALGALRRELVAAAREAGATREPMVGLQLTHSGRWSRPGPDPDRRAPRVAFRHPLLDPRSGVADDAAVLSDREVHEIVARFAGAARLAREEGFAFVDVKHCHGYLLHEFLAARSRPGRFGGADLPARLGLLRATIAAVRDAAPGLAIGVRLSAFDALPHRPDGRDADGKPGPGVAEPHQVPYRLAFGVDAERPEEPSYAEPVALARELLALGVRWLNVTGGSPYYCPHVQRPAAFPPSDGYAPPEDPLTGVARLLDAARVLKAAVPEMVVVSSGWSYLQEFVPHVAQACVRAGWFDAVGLGRMALSYPELPRDVLAGRPLDRRAICRTFSDCTTAPRSGLVSGCYPLDPFYRARPERTLLEDVKHRAQPAGGRA